MILGVVLGPGGIRGGSMVCIGSGIRGGTRRCTRGGTWGGNRGGT